MIPRPHHSLTSFSSTVPSDDVVLSQPLAQRTRITPCQPTHVRSPAPLPPRQGHRPEEEGGLGTCRRYRAHIERSDQLPLVDRAFVCRAQGEASTQLAPRLDSPDLRDPGSLLQQPLRLRHRRLLLLLQLGCSRRRCRLLLLLLDPSGLLRSQSAWRARVSRPGRSTYHLAYGICVMYVRGGRAQTSPR